MSVTFRKMAVWDEMRPDFSKQRVLISLSIDFDYFIPAAAYLNTVRDKNEID